MSTYSKFILCFYVVSYCISRRPFPCYLLSIVWSRLSDLDGPQLTKKPQRVTSWSKLNSCHWPVTKTPPIYHFWHNFRRSFQGSRQFWPNHPVTWPSKRKIPGATSFVHVHAIIIIVSIICIVRDMIEFIIRTNVETYDRFYIGILTDITILYWEHLLNRLGAWLDQWQTVTGTHAEKSGDL